MKRPTFKMLTEFAEDTKELGRQLSQFEQNVAATFATLAVLFMPRLALTETKVANFAAKLGDITRINPSTDNIRIAFPEASIVDGRIVLIRLSTANTVTLLPVKGKVQNVTSYTLGTALGAYEFVADGANWWKVV